MPTIDFGDPPQLGDDAQYTDYRPWLERVLYLRTCAYCVLRHVHLHTDHFEPRGYAEARIHDPTNLVLGCEGCNGRGGKSDYHPDHASRTRLPRDASGFAVVDIRADDFARLFAVAEDGAITARPGVQSKRAEWNIVLLNLAREPYDTVRAENLETLGIAERVIRRLNSGRGDPRRLGALQEVFDAHVRDLARTLIFFDAFGIPMSPELRARVEAARTAELADL